MGTAVQKTIGTVHNYREPQVRVHHYREPRDYDRTVNFKFLLKINKEELSETETFIVEGTAPQYFYS